MIAEQPTYGAKHCARALAVHPQRWTSRSRSLAFTTQLASPLGDVMVLVQEHSGAVASYGANEYGVLGHGSDSASKGMLPARIPDVQFEQVRVLTLLLCCTY